jgi:hypothetical protein
VNWFGGFTLDQVDVGEAVLRVRYGGANPRLRDAEENPPEPLLSGFRGIWKGYHAAQAR